MQEEDQDYRGLREYSRVDAYLPVQVRSVPEEEKEHARSKTSVESVLTDLQSLPDLEEDPVLSESLKIINSKLDTIISMLTLQCRDYSCLEFNHINLSAGGLSLSLKQSFAAGDFVEIRLMFPSVAYVVFHVYGEVLKCEPDGHGQHFTSIEFTEIDEDIRDRIAKYVFERQREILRKKRRQ